MIEMQDVFQFSDGVLAIGFALRRLRLFDARQLSLHLTFRVIIKTRVLKRLGDLLPTLLATSFCERGRSGQKTKSNDHVTK